MYRLSNDSDLEALFLRSQQKDYRKRLIWVEFSGAKADNFSVRPGRGSEMIISAVIESHRAGIEFPDRNLDEVQIYMRDNPQAAPDVFNFFRKTLKRLEPAIEKEIADRYEDPRTGDSWLSSQVFQREQDDWENIANAKVTNVRIRNPEMTPRNRLFASWSALVTFTATKKVGDVPAVFSEMSDAMLDSYIGQLRYESPTSFSGDEELSDADFYEKNRKIWRSISPRGQQKLLKNLQSGYHRVARSADRVAAAFMTANPEMDPDQAINQLPTRLAETGVSAGSDGNYMTKQNLFLLHRMSEMLYEGIPHGMLLPDWAESKINSAADHLKAVAGWAMHESHGDDLHHGPEANPIHLARRRG